MSVFRELDWVKYTGPRKKVSNLSGANEMKYINTGEVGCIVTAHTPSVFDVEFINADGTTRLWTVLEAAQLEMVRPNRLQ
jgi:Domain of unknown function (DUF4926)